MRLLIATASTLRFEAALDLGGHLAQRLDPSPVVLAVVGQESDLSAAEALLDRAASRLAPFTHAVRTRARVGRPVEEIVREAKDGGYGLVVIGEQRRRSPLLRFGWRSTAIRVAENAPCPTIVARGRIGPLHKLLLCEGGAERNSLVERFIVQAGGLLTGQEEITVLHVMSQISAGPGVEGKQLRASAMELIRQNSREGQVLESGMRAMARSGINCRVTVRHGLVVDEILAEAESGDYDLVVIGAHPGEGWRHVLLDDLARQIITRIRRPVLVIR